MSGIRLGFRIAEYYPALAVYAAVPVALLLIAAFLRRRGKFLFAIKSRVAICGAALLLCIGLGSYPLNVRKWQAQTLPTGSVCAAGLVTDLSEEEDGYRYTLTDVVIDDSICDYDIYLFTTDTFMTGDYVYAEGELEQLPLVLYGNVRSEVMAGGIYGKLTAAFSKSQGQSKNLTLACNRRIRSILKENVSPEIEPLARALLLGDSSGLNEVRKERYGSLGLLHLFAVSGLHVGFLLAILFLLTDRKLSVPIQTVIIVGVLTFYAAVIGFSPSVVRATLMAALALGAKFAGRKYDLLSALGVSAVILLLVQPGNAFDVGFLLSFSAVASLAVLVRPLSHLIRFLPRAMRTSLAASLSVGLGTFPVMAATFGEISLLTPIGNLIILPLAACAYTLMMVALLPTVILPSLGFLLLPAQLVLEVVEILVLLLNKLGAEKLAVYDMGLWAILFVIGLFLAGSRVLGPAKIRSLLGVGFALLAIAGNLLPASVPNRLCVTATSGGNVVSVQSADGARIVFLLGDDMRAYTKRELLSLGIEKADLVVIPDIGERLSAALLMKEICTYTTAIYHAADAEDRSYFARRGIELLALDEQNSLSVGNLYLSCIEQDGCYYVTDGETGVLVAEYVSNETRYALQQSAYRVDLVVGGAESLQSDFGTVMISTRNGETKDGFYSAFRLGSLVYDKLRGVRPA